MTYMSTKYINITFMSRFITTFILTYMSTDINITTFYVDQILPGSYTTPQMLFDDEIDFCRYKCDINVMILVYNDIIQCRYN
jgi:hypothetical protein